MIFLITFERMRRYEGSWHYQAEMLFQGYVFAEVENRKHLEEAAYRTMMFRTFGSGEYSLCLDDTERKFLEDVGGTEHHIIMSRGYIRNGVTFVTEGPLCGRECNIRKINRHKRMAQIDSTLERYQERGIWMGLEITAKD